MSCPLCYHSVLLPVGEFQQRCYWLCCRCDLISMDRTDLPTLEAEKQIYDYHNNQADDPGYLRFLSRLVKPLQAKLQPGQSGLDYGCGPGPAMDKLFGQLGYKVACYDPIYAPERGLLERSYDFVTSSEVVEHFHHPAESWQELVGLVKPGGWLGIMTKRHLGAERFASWHYKNDPTHVAFYSEASLRWIAEQWRLTIEFIGADVALMKKL